MYKVICFSVCLYFSSLMGFCQLIGKTFPSISGENMEGKTLQIPTDIKGKFSLIALAYSRDAEDDLKTWLQPAYQTFISENTAFNYDINLFFVPIFTGTTQSLTKKAKEKVKQETDKAWHTHILFSEERINNLKKELEIKEKEKPYFYILDKEGKIVYTTNGKFTSKKMEELEDHLN